MHRYLREKSRVSSILVEFLTYQNAGISALGDYLRPSAGQTPAEAAPRSAVAICGAPESDVEKMVLVFLHWK